MTERPVNFVIAVEGGDEGQQEFEDMAIAQQEAAEQTTRLTAALRELQKAGGDNAKAIDAMRRQVVRAQQAQEQLRAEAGGTTVETIALRQKLGQLGTTVGQVGAVLGRVNPEWAKMSTVIGGIGSQIPALTGSLGPVAQAIAAITVAVDLGILAWEAWTGEVQGAGEAADATKRHVTDLANSLTQLHERQMAIAGRGAIAPLEERFEALDARALALQQVLDAERAEAEGRREIAAGRIAELRQQQRDNAARLADINRQGGIQAVDEAGRAIEIIQRSVQISNDRVRNLAAGARAAQAQSEEAEDALAAARARPVGFGELEAPETGGGGGGGGGRAAALRQQAAEQRDIALELAEMHADIASAQEQAQRDLQSEIAVTAALQAETAQQVQQIENELEASRLAAIQRVADAREEAAEKQIELLEEQKRRAQDASEAVRADAEGVLGPVISGLTDTLGKIIAGAESADEAFQGLLASFLAMISQQAALEAAKEFAAAIADFASLNVAGGGLHLAAGVAWTAVAVAAGAASVAVAPPVAPVSPEAAQDTGGGAGDGGTNVFNINGTVISADGPGARARAGREVAALTAEGSRRFGRA